MAGLVGEFHHKLDAKGRVSLPAGFRKILPENLKVTVAPEGNCLLVFEPDEFNQWVKGFFGSSEKGYNQADDRHRDLRRILNSRARDIEVDAAGRINISADLRSDVGLDKEVVIIGDTDHLEIWDAKRWSDYLGAIDLLALIKG